MYRARELRIVSKVPMVVWTDLLEHVVLEAALGLDRRVDLDHHVAGHPQWHQRIVGHPLLEVADADGDDADARLYVAQERGLEVTLRFGVGLGTSPRTGLG